ncbi:MAG: DUF1844 domain-containing protein [Lentisphaerae bacterium]|jgi:hypothetical protein|nr:DUF1844 domain-containing protein [Lentisphaerota bacterium]
MSAQTSETALFHGLVVSLAATVMQYLGKTINPMTNKAEVNLDAAQTMIDTLDMLTVKTKGNLSDAEAKLLGGILAELKLNYVETMNSGKEEPAKEPAAEENAAADSAQSEPDAEPNG